MSDDLVQGLRDRREEQAKRRASARVFAYTHFYELRRIIERNWEKFAPALGAKKEFGVLADLVEDYETRQPIAGSLLTHEVSMLAGIAGTMRTQVTAYLSSC